MSSVRACLVTLLFAALAQSLCPETVILVAVCLTCPDQDQYNWIACPIEEPGVHVFVWIDGASNTTSEVFMFCDVSVVCFDNIDGTGVDVFQSVYGYIDEKEGPVLMTIFP